MALHRDAPKRRFLKGSEIVHNEMSKLVRKGSTDEWSRT